MAVLPSSQCLVAVLGLFITSTHCLNGGNSFYPPTAEELASLSSSNELAFTPQNLAVNSSVVSEGDSLFMDMPHLAPRGLVDSRQTCDPGTYLCLGGTRCCPDGFTCDSYVRCCSPRSPVPCGSTIHCYDPSRSTCCQETGGNCVHGLVCAFGGWRCCPATHPQYCSDTAGCYDPKTQVCCGNFLCPADKPACQDGGGCCPRGETRCGLDKCYNPQTQVCCVDSKMGLAWGCKKGGQCCEGASRCYLPDSQICCEEMLCEKGETCCKKECCRKGQICGLDGYCTTAQGTTVTVTASQSQTSAPEEDETALPSLPTPKFPTQSANNETAGVPMVTPHPIIIAVNLAIILAVAG